MKHILSYIDPSPLSTSSLLSRTHLQKPLLNTHSQISTSTALSLSLSRASSKEKKIPKWKEKRSPKRQEEKNRPRNRRRERKKRPQIFRSPSSRVLSRCKHSPLFNAVLSLLLCPRPRLVRAPIRHSWRCGKLNLERLLDRHLRVTM